MKTLSATPRAAIAARRSSPSRCGWKMRLSCAKYMSSGKPITTSAMIVITDSNTFCRSSSRRIGMSRQCDQLAKHARTSCAAPICTVNALFYSLEQLWDVMPCCRSRKAFLGAYLYDNQRTISGQQRMKWSGDGIPCAERRSIKGRWHLNPPLPIISASPINGATPLAAIP